MRNPRVVFAAYALRGHINKRIALAAELAERGHKEIEVLIERFAEPAERGLPGARVSPAGDSPARV